MNIFSPTPAGMDKTGTLARPGLVNRRVAVLVYDGLCTFEFGIAVEVFGLPRPEFGEAWYEFGVCGIGRGPYRATGGFRIEVDTDIAQLAEAGTIIIPGWRNPGERPPEDLLQALRAAHARGARLMSICSGVFVLAATGLLKGKRATTHWRYTDLLRARHPEIIVAPEVLYVDEGQILSSAGSAAGLDLSLHLVRRDFGAKVANQVARRLVVPPHRDGGQAQFVERPLPDRADTRFGRLFETLRQDLAGEHTVASMAAISAMSERTFLRRFHEATGTSPSEWLAAERVKRAKELLETSRFSIEEIAEAAGFTSAATMRHHFRKRLGISPTRYRAAFSANAEAVVSMSAA